MMIFGMCFVCLCIEATIYYGGEQVFQRETEPRQWTANFEIGPHSKLIQQIDTRVNKNKEIINFF